MISIGEHRTGSFEDSVHRSGEPCSDCLHATPESVSAFGLDDQMSVIALQRVVHEPERASLTRPRERSLHFAHELHCSQRRDVLSNLQRYVGREIASEALARAVADPRVRPWRPSGARSSTAVSDPVELELFC